MQIGMYENMHNILTTHMTSFIHTCNNNIHIAVSSMIHYLIRYVHRFFFHRFHKFINLLLQSI